MSNRWSLRKQLFSWHDLKPTANEALHRVSRSLAKWAPPCHVASCVFSHVATRSWKWCLTRSHHELEHWCTVVYCVLQLLLSILEPHVTLFGCTDGNSGRKDGRRYHPCLVQMSVTASPFARWSNGTYKVSPPSAPLTLCSMEPD